MNFFEMFLWFLIFSFIGWLWEVILYYQALHKFVNRGFLNGPYCPIYGVGGLLFILTTNQIPDPFLRGLAGGAIACILEYITSYALEVLFHARWWDYSNRPFNLNGRICLYGFLLFGAAAVGMPYIIQPFAALTGAMPEPFRTILSSLLMVVFIMDIFATNQGLIKLNKALKEYQKFLDKHTSQLINFIRKGKRAFEMRFESGRKKARTILTYQQRRIIAAFPQMRSTRYNDALQEFRALLERSRTPGKKRKK